MKNTYQFFPFLIFIGIIFIFSNCSAIGAGIGYSKDKENMKIARQVPLEQIATLTKGHRIVVQMKNGTIEKGNMVMLIRMEEEPNAYEYLVLKNRNDLQQKLEVENIASIEIKPKRNNVWKGLGLGAIVDVFTLVITVAISFQNFDLL